MGIVGFIVILVIFGISGIMCWASSDLPRVVREVALNTRREGSSGTNYPLIGLLSVMMKVWAAIIWLAGLVLAIVMLKLGEMLALLLSEGMFK
jgi:hypothetical protein